LAAHQGNHFNYERPRRRADGNVCFTDRTGGSEAARRNEMEVSISVSPSGDVTLVDGGLHKRTA
jgi:hypothetical protein